MTLWTKENQKFIFHRPSIKVDSIFGTIIFWNLAEFGRSVR